YWTDQPMVHIYGHSWPVRWGDVNEEKMVKVYSNCTEAEIFLNGKSFGSKKRNSQDYPAAGLRWNLPFIKGENIVKVIAKKGKVVVNDEVSFVYQTDKWTKPAYLTLTKILQENNVVTLEAKIFDQKGVQCLDAANWINFGLTGGGELIADQGTSSGSRKVQAYNGRALIRLRMADGKCAASVSSEGMKTVILML
ncbi:MAG: DUF4982 domain-containing protein, partial [Pedobacter sp.]